MSAERFPRPFPDPNTSTREEWTAAMIEEPLPENAAPEWREMVVTLRELLDKLAHHTAMRPNLQQTFMTPANMKTKVYFIWDFVGRTLGYAYQVPATMQNLSSGHRSVWADVISRSVLTATLILDRNPGMLDMMVDSTYPGQTGELPFGQKPVFGNDIKALARRLEG